MQRRLGLLQLRGQCRGIAIQALIVLIAAREQGAQFFKVGRAPAHTRLEPLGNGAVVGGGGMRGGTFLTRRLGRLELRGAGLSRQGHCVLTEGTGRDSGQD